MTREREDAFQWWCAALGINDWQIRLTDEVDPWDMPIEDAYGCTTVSETVKSAVVEIVNINKVRSEPGDFDWEQVLVHELLHIKLALLFENGETESLHDRLLHQQMNDLSVVMVKAKRA